MTNNPLDTDVMNHAVRCLSHWLESKLPPDHWRWLCSQIDGIRQSDSERELHIALGFVPRKLGRADLALSIEDVAHAQRETGTTWDPGHWTIETAARTLLLCAAAQRKPEQFGELFKSLTQTADLTESITFYQGIALFPHDATIDKQIGEGLRTNIRAVFEAIAHHNPYPRMHFDENRWNHMVLKALFIDSTLSPIQGLDERANPELARILCDYAHERWAAHRPVTPELWRCVGPFATGTMIDDLKRVAASSSTLEQHAGVLALSQCDHGNSVLEDYSSIQQLVADGSLTWDSIAAQMSEAP